MYAALLISYMYSYELLASLNNKLIHFDFFRWLRTVSIILFLNKMDMLKKKVEEKIFPIEDYFPEYSNYRPPQPDSSG